MGCNAGQCNEISTPLRYFYWDTFSPWGKPDPAGYQRSISMSWGKMSGHSTLLKNSVSQALIVKCISQALIVKCIYSTFENFKLYCSELKQKFIQIGYKPDILDKHLKN